jgi:AraC family transcriptional activator FtrA
MSHRSSHRVVVIADEGSNPFELGVATELFGLRRPELGRPWYDLTICTPRPDVLFVDDGDVLTAAGSAAALDLGLHLIRRDHGAEVANSVSRRLVFAAHRDGGQRQFIERPVPAVRDTSLAPVLAWAQQHLDRPLTVADLAARAATSQATLHRRFQAELGTTPLAWLTAERVALACRLIERGELRLDTVAHASGLGTAANLRTQLRRRTGLTPTAYRRRFGNGEPVTP